MDQQQQQAPIAEEDEERTEVVARQPLLSDSFKFLVFLYNTYITRSAKLIRTRDGGGGTRKVCVADLDCCPELVRWRKLANFYHDLSTVTHFCLMLFYSIFYNRILDYKITEANYYFRCYSPRYTLAKSISQRQSLGFAAVLCCCHMIWRYLVTIYQREFNIDMIAFLLNGSEQDFRDCLNANGKGEEEEQEELLAASAHAPLMEVMYYRQLDSVTNQVRLRLRPNRSARARKILLKKVNDLFDFGLKSSLLLGSINLTAAFHQLIVDQDLIFPSCGQSAAAASWSFVVRNLGSTLVNLISYFDAYPALFFSILTAPLLIFDLDLYWLHISERIPKLRQELLAWRRLERDLNHSQDQSAAAGAATTQIHLNAPTARNRQLRKREQLIRDIADLQTQLVDFFALVHRTDQYVCIVTPFSMFVWLICNAWFTLSGLQLDNSSESNSVRLLQLLALILSGIISGFAVAFKRRIELAYGPLCSLMAMDPNIRKAYKWTRVMSYYTEKPRYAFSIFGAGIYSRLTYLTYISYTITFAVLAESYGIRVRA